jgi:hypothetical protein
MTGEDAQRCGQSDEEEKDNDREEESTGNVVHAPLPLEVYYNNPPGGEKNKCEIPLTFLSCPLDYIELSKNIQRTNASIIYLFKLIIRKT